MSVSAVRSTRLIRRSVKGSQVVGTPSSVGSSDASVPKPSRRHSLRSLWDTRPISDQAFEPEDREIPVPGANDGASGTAVLLQLAEILSNNPAARTVDILLVDGEDYGDFGQGKDVFLGSRYFASNLPPHLDVEFGVLLDMVGDRDLEIFVEGHSNRRVITVPTTPRLEPETLSGVSCGVCQYG